MTSNRKTRGWMRALIIAAGMTIAPAAAGAGAIVDQGLEESELPSFDSTFGISQQADDFTLDAPREITGVRWWGNDFAGFDESDDFTIRFFTGTGASDPVEGLVEERTGLSVTETDSAFVDDFGFAINLYETSFDPVDFEAGSFFISIVNDFALDSWLWSLSNLTGSSYFRTAEGDAWQTHDPEFDVDGDFAFQLLSEPQNIPVPAGWPLFALGLAGVAAMGSGRRRARS